MTTLPLYPLVICSKCADNGRKSKVYQTSSSTLMAYESFYDEDGKYHSHNPNPFKKYYYCSNGHSWNVATYQQCPQGDYK